MLCNIPVHMSGDAHVPILQIIKIQAKSFFLRLFYYEQTKKGHLWMTASYHDDDKVQRMYGYDRLVIILLL